jgi:hypothetical protein
MGFAWHTKTDDQLLNMKLSELPVRLKDTWIQKAIHRLYDELADRGLVFRPHCWLAEEWFSPDGVPGVAIPFYLAHPRLSKLEQKFMLEIEGGSESRLMRILRHEAGHAIDTAYRLHFKRRWQQLFGSFAETYPDSYRPRPNSRKYVLHLRGWYAQAHPAEDFAETFAVWLTPGSSWRRRYQGWPALRKLEYVNQLMEEIAGQRPVIKRRHHVEPLTKNTTLLKDYYAKKREHYTTEWPKQYDRDLLKVFSLDPKHKKRPSATLFIRSNRQKLSQAVADGTGVHPYTISHILEHLSKRGKTLGLRVGASPTETRQRLLILLTVQTMNAIHSGYYQMAL